MEAVYYNDEELQAEIYYTPAEGDGFNDPIIEESVEIEILYRDGEDVTSEFTQAEIWDLADQLLKNMREAWALRDI